MQSSLKSITQHPLTQKDKIGALRRYFLFHILGWLSPSPILYPYVGKVVFFAKPGMAGIVGNIYMGLDDFEEQGFLMHLLTPNDLFADVGANVGSYTLLASGVCGAASIAIEPIPNTFENLMSNIKVNNLQALVKTFNVGIGSRRGKLLFTNNYDVMNKVVSENHNLTDPEHTTLVEVIPLDELLKNHPPLLLKIDVEGYEQEVISGANEILQNSTLRAVIIELSALKNTHGFSYEKTNDLLINNGFAPYAYDPFNRTLEKLSKFNQEKFNTLYLRDIEWVKNRVTKAPKITILGQSI